MLFGFFISFIYTILKYIVFKNTKIENKIENNKDNNKDNNTNNIEPNIYNKLYNFIKLIIIGYIVWKFFGVGNIAYCDDPSGESNNSNNTNSTNSNTNTDKNNDTVKNKVKGSNDENSYNFSGSVGKGMIKEAVQGAVVGISNAIPPVMGGIAGASLGGAIIKASSKLPPTQKAALGVATAVIGGLGVTVATAFGKKIVKPESNSKEVSSSESSGSGFNPSTSKEGNAYIPSILEDELSPLQ
jgi:hypothetical protein